MIAFPFDAEIDDATDWATRHRLSENLAAGAQIAAHQGLVGKATRLYREAAQAEALAVKVLDPSKRRTLGITAVSVVALWLKADEPHEAVRHAAEYLKLDLPRFAATQLGEMMRVEPTTLRVINFASDQLHGVIAGLLDDPSHLLDAERAMEPADYLAELRALASDLGIDYDAEIAKGSFLERDRLAKIATGVIKPRSR